MTYSHYERLSSLDASFLELEDANCPMHVGAVAVFEAGPLSRADGGVDIERFRRFVEAVLQPRYRQRIVRMPVTRDPIWVDDPHLNLHYHVRHVSLPHPGDERRLKRLAGHALPGALRRQVEAAGFEVLSQQRIFRLPAPVVFPPVLTEAVRSERAFG